LGRLENTKRIGLKTGIVERKFSEAGGQLIITGEERRWRPRGIRAGTDSLLKTTVRWVQIQRGRRPRQGEEATLMCKKVRGG